MAQLARHVGWQTIAPDIEQCLAFAALATMKDPMDRLVAASPRALGCAVVSADEALDAAGVDRIWE